MARRKDFSLPVATRTGEGDRRLRKHILEAIARMARQLGRTPSVAEFAGRSGISKHRVMRIFSKWNEAVRAAGLEPGRLYKRLAKDELLRDWGEAVRKRGGVPSRTWYMANGEYYPRTLEKRFGGVGGGAGGISQIRGMQAGVERRGGAVGEGGSMGAKLLPGVAGYEPTFASKARLCRWRPKMGHPTHRPTVHPHEGEGKRAACTV